MFKHKHTLAKRLGKTCHISPLRFKLRRLAALYPVDGAEYVEEWLVAVANKRGFQVIVRPGQDISELILPDKELLSDEELTVGLSMLQCADYPQILRLACQIISREKADLTKLPLIAERERVEPILAELSKQALKVAPEHPTWRAIYNQYKNEKALTEPLLHWTRLAEPIMKNGRCNVSEWVLAS